MHAVPGRQHNVRRRTAWLTSARASEGTHVSRKAGEREVQTGAGGRAGAGRAERDEGGRKAQRGASRHGVSAAPRRHRRVRGGAQRRRAIACRGARARSTTNHDAHIPAPRRPSQCQARHTHLPASSAARCASPSPKGQRAPRTQGLPRTSLFGPRTGHAHALQSSSSEGDAACRRDQRRRRRERQGEWEDRQRGRVRLRGPRACATPQVRGGCWGRSVLCARVRREQMRRTRRCTRARATRA